IRRALRFRDAGCRFPGCTHTHFVDGHHIKHWADGGETSLNNLVQLCRHHHRLVHEGGYACERSAEGSIEIRSPAGIKLPAHPPIPGVANPSHLKKWIQRDNPTADIDELTCVPLWAGERMDWDTAVERLFG
ncbi:MAG: HNH endonuclease, partial [Gammaproteobacteria bacterium]|nr:HNH endonuclease [Gammaproteobacteria bacterium]